MRHDTPYVRINVKKKTHDRFMKWAKTHMEFGETPDTAFNKLLDIAERREIQ